MERSGSVPLFDPLLVPLLEAEEQEREHLCIQLLAQHADPIVRQVVRRRLGSGLHGAQDVEDVRSEVVVQLLARLEEFRTDPVQKAIANLEGYVAVMAYHACDQYLRRRYPRRARLKNRLRYALTHSPELAIWPGSHGASLCGLVAWREEEGVRAPGARLQRLKADPHVVGEAVWGGREPEATPPAELLVTLFAWLGHPLELAEVVELAATLLRIRDSEPAALPDEARLSDREVGSATAPPDSLLDQRRFLERLWSELPLLPPRQRTALLLNLRDDQGCDMLDLLLFTGTTTFRDLALVLELPAEELAALWNRLPLPDAEIAGRLGATRQQVINLRKCARERLWRRLRDVRQ